MPVVEGTLRRVFFGVEVPPDDHRTILTAGRNAAVVGVTRYTRERD